MRHLINITMLMDEEAGNENDADPHNQKPQ